MTDSAIHKTTLGNGLRVATEAISDSRSSAIGVWIAVGSRDEAPEQSGASHFLEHLLFKGTQDRSSREVAEMIDGVGGDMNAFTAREHTAFYARVPATARQMASELLFDVVRYPALRQVDVDAERQVINEELVAAYDTPDDVVHIVLYERLFGDHPLGREVLGEPDTINALDTPDIRAFHRHWYGPSNIVIAASGDVDHDELCGLAESRFGDLLANEVPERVAPDALHPEVVKTALPVEQVHVAMGWRCISHDDDRRYALAIANQVLGGSPSSRLFQSIREDQALAYSVFSQTSGYADSGSATIYAATSAQRGEELIGALSDEIDKLVTDGVTQRELDLARTGLEGAVVLGLEGSGSRMSRLATNEALRGQVLSIDEFLERLSALTIDEVNQVIADVYGGPAITSLVGPEAALGTLT